jgi:hypothetical protein
VDTRSVLAGDPFAYAGSKLPARNYSTRAQRALKLFEERADEFERIAPDVYLVPSSAGSGRCFYRVDYALETCECPDYTHHPGRACKHILVVGILHAKRRVRRVRCEGCGRRFAYRELLEVQDWHESLTFFEGDLICEACAGAHGVV